MKRQFVDDLQGSELAAEEGRGNADALTKSLKCSNFCMVFGTVQGKQVKLDTKMVKNILNHILFRQDKVKSCV